MQTLPIQEFIPEIRSQLRSHNKLILQAAPGAGKTTLVPLALLGESWLHHRQILILEPRRLATRNAAGRMAELLGEKLGQRVGYQIRAERCISTQTKIIVVTEGILTRMLQSDPALENIALIIFDEFHERNLHGDLALALSLQSQELLRSDLKIMLMSATLNTNALVTLLDNAPLICSTGRSYPVENSYLTTKIAQPLVKQLPALILKTVLEVLNTQKGSILIFLPGAKEIKNLQKRLHEHIQDSTLFIAPLYGTMSKEAQDSAIIPCREGYRKIVIATNIAETSLTIEGISVVIDSGLQRVSQFNSGSGLNQLRTVKISQDSATQRSGRAGRLQAGRCYRMWHEHTQLAPHATPEILTSDIAPMMLELAAWGVSDVNELHWLDLPNPNALKHARELLEELGALKEQQITPHGREILELATHPRLAHMMLKAKEIGHGDTASLIAALLSEKDFFLGDARRSMDISERIRLLHVKHCEHQCDYTAFERVLKTAKTFQKKLKLSSHQKAFSADMVGVLLGFAYPDRIAQSRGFKNSRYLLSNGKGALMPNEDQLFSEPYLVVADLNASQSDALIYQAASITAAQIEEFFSELITKKHRTYYNDDAERIESRELLQLGAITLRESILQNIDSKEITTALIASIKTKGLKSLNFSRESLALRERITFLNYWKSKEKSLENIIGEIPYLSESWLLDHLDIWLAPYLEGIKTFSACRKLNMYAILLNLLTWEQQERLERLAPKKIEVPSGSKITIDYENPQSPVLAVRLQELFGMLETPKLIHSHVSLSVELLSPARRPMQITKDLRSFWETTYHDVKKELRGKYKKHYWPDDPFEAIATSKTKKNM
ncbi:MAG: ATP-dependent helicase HrpB [Campylobacterota bacterium]|nr:ATP-dependent helicase HrpB [Campylobacterota bacterium]